MNVLLLLVGGIATYVTKFYNLFIFELRLNTDVSDMMYNYLKEHEHWSKEHKTTFTKHDLEIPKETSSFHWLTLPFLYTITENELKAGYMAKERISKLYTAVFLRKRLIRFVRNVYDKQKLSKDIYTLMYIYGSYLTTNKITECKKPFLEKSVEENIESTIGEFVNDKRERLGLMLHGPAGNGKTSLIKYLAFKHHMNVYIPVFTSNMSNTALIEMFRELPTDQKSIVVFEDFDSVFDGRTPIFKNAEFSFDTFINLLDGVYCNTKNLLFIMTSNKLDKVDRALKSRPSRFDIVAEIGNPSFNERVSILKSSMNGQTEHVARLTDGQSAAVVSEISKHKFDSNLDEKVLSIIESFN